MGYSIFGLVVAFNGLYLTKESEQDEVVGDSNESINSSIVLLPGETEEQAKERQQGFFYKLSRNFSQIGQAMVMPEIYLVILFFVLNGLVSPDFGDFGYYFMLNVVKISKF